MATDPIRVAQYVRMSTERQEYSPTFQREANEAYARLHGMAIVRTYEDAGISGLSLRNREGLKSLLADVLSGDGGFTHVLVYDVSRWGRFQNPDQAAYYEFMCAQAGVLVCYCAETFENDGSPTSGLLKHIKRTMAAEYSRDLSEKVSLAQRGLLAQGFWTGGRAPIGLRRIFTRSDGTAIAAPAGSFVRKQQGVRTKLVLASDDEVALVRRIFSTYLRPKETCVSVARKLRADGTLKPEWGEWSSNRVRYILGNDIYVGKLMGGRCDRPIGVKVGGELPRSEWLVVDDAVPAIVTSKTFDAARRKRVRNRTAISREAALADLRRIANEHGQVSQKLMSAHGRWGVGVYTRQVGTVATIRGLLGLATAEMNNNLRLYRGKNRLGGGKQTYSMSDLAAHLRKVLSAQGRLSREVIDASGGPSSFTIGRRFGSMEAAYREIGYQPDANQLRRFENVRRLKRVADERRH